MENGIIQQQLADVIGVTQQSVNKYENHSVEPDIETLIKLADYFKTTIDYLVGRHCEAVSVITEEEKQLVSDFRRLNDIEKQIIHLCIKNSKCVNFHHGHFPAHPG